MTQTVHTPFPSILQSVPSLARAYHMQTDVVRHVHDVMTAVIQNRDDLPSEFAVSVAPLPQGRLTFDQNIFSSFFIAALMLLPLSPERLQLYAAINHLFRIWVTCADNLLDDENKETIPFVMPQGSRIMRQVIGLMLADRTLQVLMDDAVDEAVLTRAEARTLSMQSLQILLPSAAEEATEEGGMDHVPPPDHVLTCLHPLKTGLLFHVTFLGPDAIEEGLDAAHLADIKEAMMDFGIGCQILDDIRDMARDWGQRRANYLISLIHHSPDSKRLLTQLQQHTVGLDPDARLYQAFPHVTQQAGALARAKLASAMKRLDRLGMEGLGLYAREIVVLLIHKLDLTETEFAA